MSPLERMRVEVEEAYEALLLLEQALQRYEQVQQLLQELKESV